MFSVSESSDQCSAKSWAHNASDYQELKDSFTVVGRQVNKFSGKDSRSSEIPCTKMVTVGLYYCKRVSRILKEIG